MQPPGRQNGGRAPSSPGSGGPLQLTRFHSRSSAPAPTYVQPAEQEDPAFTTKPILRPGFFLIALGLGLTAVVLMYSPEAAPTGLLIGAAEGLVPFAIARCWEDGRFGTIALLVCVVAGGVLGPIWGGLVALLLTVVAFNRNR